MRFKWIYAWFIRGFWNDLSMEHEENFDLPKIGEQGIYILPAIIVNGETLAVEKRIPAKVIGHIKPYRIKLQEIENPRMYIETHYKSFNIK